MAHAQYDNNGDIVILTEEVVRSATNESGKTMTQRTSRASVLWNTESGEKMQEKKPTPPVQKQGIAKESHPSLVGASFLEGKEQFKATTKSAKQGIGDLLAGIRLLPKRTGATLKKMWKAAGSPVTLRGKRKEKTRTKGQLFLMDTVRFGGTFALIFGVLFVAMNFTSFWQIARSQLALGVDIQKTEALEKLSMGGSVMSDVEPRTSFTAGSIMQYLPLVGPPKNMLIIPTLGITVPIEQPSMTSLLKQDWAGFEKDIQKSLENGVVHYPGSAVPGQAGNFFVTGHSSYYAWAKGNYKEVFARLHELQIGDTYFVYFNGDKHKYMVTEKYVVKPNNVTVLDQPSNKRLSTLMTCTPVGTTVNRLIVKAEEIDPMTGIALAVGEKLPVTDASQIFTGLSALPI